MDAGAPGPPGLGGAAHQLVITATQDLRDVAVSYTCLRAAGLDPIGVRRGRRRRGMGGMAGPPRAERTGDMTAPTEEHIEKAASWPASPSGEASTL
jgi:hypothetical protein